MSGRGLGMVELLADHWGVEADDGGKVVWFLLAGPDSVPLAPRPADVPSEAPSFLVRFEKLPVPLVTAAVQHGDSLLRELALLAIGEDEATGLSAWQAPHIDLGPLLAVLEEADRTGRASIDVEVAFPEGSGAGALERLALVEGAERDAREGGLLTVPAVPEVGACRRWYLSQIGLQADGEAPVAWALPAPLEPVVDAAQLSGADLARLDGLTAAAVVADHGNRIVYVNARAAALLGWEPDDLVGRRLVAIVPAELRESHLAGFTRQLVGGNATILDRPVRLPALRRDGTTVEVELLVETLALEGGRPAFLGTLT